MLNMSYQNGRIIMFILRIYQRHHACIMSTVVPNKHIGPNHGQVMYNDVP